MRTQLPAVLLATVLVCPVFAAPAQAQTRAFVSTAGSDSNNCINTLTPCRHFQTAYNAMPNGGEIDVLDPGNYGALTVTHTLSIVGRGWATLSPVSGAAAITINSGASDTISISGVALDGAHLANTNGIVFNSGSSLTVDDCVVQNFSGSSGAIGNGILVQPSSGSVVFTVTNTIVSNNGNVGILYLPPSGSPNALGVIDHVVATANGYGIAIESVFSSGGTTRVAISNSVASDNLTDGIVVTNGVTLTVSIDNVSVSGNPSGIVAGGTANVLLGRSVITGNGVGVQNSTIPNTLYTYKDNRINLNTTADITGTVLNTTLALQ